MNIKKILADAPEGAQRYNHHLPSPYLRKTKNSVDYWANHRWVGYVSETFRDIDWDEAVTLVSLQRGYITDDDDVDNTVAQRTVESSAVKTLELLGYVWNGGEQLNAPSYITDDDVDNTVTQRGERYGLFADGVKYERTLVGLCGTHVKTDVYRVLDAFNTGDPILDHLIKKALCAGSRGHKDKLTDYRNIVESAEKALKLLEQKQNGN